MYVTVVAIMCHLIVASPTFAPDADCTAEEASVEEIITDSSMDEFADFFGCMVQGQIGAADWKGKHPIYRSDKWRIARIKCVPGHYEVHGKA